MGATNSLKKQWTFDTFTQRFKGCLVRLCIIQKVFLKKKRTFDVFPFIYVLFAECTSDGPLMYVRTRNRDGHPPITVYIRTKDKCVYPLQRFSVLASIFSNGF
jgi:hypothetical protein